MTTDEITALRIEFEDALLTACCNFKEKTGVSVRAIYVQRVTVQQLQRQPESHVCRVQVELESL